MSQYQPPVPPVTTSRNSVATGATTSRRNGPLSIRGVAATGGPAPRTGYSGRALPLAAGDDPEGARALRLLLKRLLRSFGFRCIECRPAPDDRIVNEVERAELVNAVEVQPF